MDPEFVHFKAFNMIRGNKMPVHKSKRMVASIAEGIRQSNEKLYNNNFKGASNIHPAQFYTSDIRGIQRQGLQVKIVEGSDLEDSQSSGLKESKASQLQS